VFYGAEQRTVDLAQVASSNVGTVSVQTIYDNLTTMLDTGVTLVQQVNNSGSTTNPNATFASTPTNGNAMIALVVRGADNVASTNGSWTLLTSAGVTALRRLEVWWRRAGASEPTLHTWTNGTAALWEVTLIEFGGWAAYADPELITAAANFTTATTASFVNTGILESVCAVVTSGGSAGTFTNTGTNTESVTNLPFFTTTRFRAMSVDGYTNRPIDQTNQITYTTSRPRTQAQVGWRNGYDGAQAGGIFDSVIGNDASTAAVFAGQVAQRYDTSTIPDLDTVTSATLTLLADNNPLAYPNNTSVNVYSLNAAAIAADNSNTRTVWKKPTEIQALTRVATRAAGSAWTGSTAYTWTSDSTFPAAINKTGNTTLLIATNDQQTGTLRATRECMNITATPGDHYLTVVHDLLIARAGGLASAEVVAGVTRLVNLLVRVGGKTSDEAFGGIGRFDLVAPIGSITTGEQFGGAALATLIARAGGIPSGELVAGISSISTLGFQNLYPGSISSGEAFGSFTIYKVGGSVVAAHTVTGIVVATAPTVTGLVAAVESLTGAVASTHLVQP
jgi:hypothetical protein